MDLLLVLACLAVLAWLLGPWLATAVRAISTTQALEQLAWSLARQAQRTETPPPPRAPLPGLGEATVTWWGTIGRCGLLHVAATTTVPLPSWGRTLGGGVLNLRATATMPGDAYVAGTTVGVCGAL